MTENLIVNGKTYKGAKAVAITNSDGEQKLYYTDAVRSINGATPDENGNVTVKLGVDAAELSEAVETALTEAKESGEFDGPAGPPGEPGKDGKDGATGPTGVHVGPEAPTDGQTIWIDTNEEPEEDSGGNNSPIVVETAPPDFAANEGEEGYIKNRTHYIDENGIVHKLSNKYIDADWMATSVEQGGTIIHYTEIAFAENSGTVFLSEHGGAFKVDAGIDLDVYWNGVKYVCPLKMHDGEPYLGNGSLGLYGAEDTGEPFCLYGSFLAPDIIAYVKKSSSAAETIELRVTVKSEVFYNKLPKEFLPDGVAIAPTAEVGQTIIVEEVDGNGKPTKWKSADLRDIIDNRLKELGVIEGSIE